MYVLTTSQVKQIEVIVNHADVHYSHLHDDLVDHICCDVEQNITHGFSYEESLKRVQQKFGIQTLKQIQEDTRVLTDKKYRIMKTSMKIFGNISLAMLGLATIFKLFHFPGAGIIMVLAFLLTALIFFPSAIYANYKGTKSKLKGGLHIAAFLGGVLYLGGILFTLQHWPGSNILWLAGVSILLFLFIPLLSISVIKNKDKNKNIYFVGILSLALFFLYEFLGVLHLPGSKIVGFVSAVIFTLLFLPMYGMKICYPKKGISGSFIFLTIAAMAVILFFTLLSITTSKVLLVPLVKQTNYTEAINHYFQAKNYDLSKDSSAKAKIDEVNKKTGALLSSIKKVKTKLLMISDAKSKIPVNDKRLQTQKIKNARDYKNTHKYLIEENVAKQLKVELEQYKAFLLHSIAMNNLQMQSTINELLPIHEVVPKNEGISWEQYHFGHAMLVNAINTLSTLELNVHITRNEIIKSLSVVEPLKTGKS